VIDFLFFKTLVSPTVLILFYYMGAIIMPPIIWFFSRWIMKKSNLVEKSYKSSKTLFFQIIPLKYKLIFIPLFLGMFLFMELLWRMMFEFLIAYFQIRDALLVS